MRFSLARIPPNFKKNRQMSLWMVQDFGSVLAPKQTEVGEDGLSLFSFKFLCYKNTGEMHAALNCKPHRQPFARYILFSRRCGLVSEDFIAQR